MSELEELTIKILVQRERIISLAKQLELIDRIIEQKIDNLNQDITNKINKLDEEIKRTINYINYYFNLTGVSK